jgi:hypothetical protein
MGLRGDFKGYTRRKIVAQQSPEICGFGAKVAENKSRRLCKVCGAPPKNGQARTKPQSREEFKEAALSLCGFVSSCESNKRPDQSDCAFVLAAPKTGCPTPDFMI